MIPINRPDIAFHEIFSALHGKINDRDVESQFSKYLNKDMECLFTASGKMASFLLFKFLELKGSIITSPLTCSIALKPILANKLPIRFVDIENNSLNIDPEIVEYEFYKTDASAVFAIHLGGNPCDLDRLKKIADNHGIDLIEDCAQALGSKYRGMKVGTVGKHSIFSFSKTMWLSGGGMICSYDRKLINRIREFQNTLNEMPAGLLRYRILRDAIESMRGKVFGDAIYHHKFLKSPKNANIKINIENYFSSKNVLHKPSRYQAEMVGRQLKGMDDSNSKRKENASKLIKLIGNNFQVQKVNPGCFSVYSKFFIVTPFNTHILLQYLNGQGIDAKHLTKSHGLYIQPRFDSKKENFSDNKSLVKCRKYFRVHDRIVSLPLSSNMSMEEISYIANVMNSLRNIVDESIQKIDN